MQRRADADDDADREREKRSPHGTHLSFTS
jgi:hypothetical protein